MKQIGAWTDFCGSFLQSFQTIALERWWWIWNGWNVETTSNKQPISWTYPLTQDATPWLKWRAKLWDLFFYLVFFCHRFDKYARQTGDHLPHQFMEVIKKHEQIIVQPPGFEVFLCISFICSLLNFPHLPVFPIYSTKKNTPKNVGCPRNGTGITGIIGGPETPVPTWKIHETKIPCKFHAIKQHMKKTSTLQGINISRLGKRKIIFKMPFWGDMLVPWRVLSLGQGWSILDKGVNFWDKGVNCIQFKHMF